MSTQVYKNKWKHFPMLNPTYCLPLSESLSSESPSFFFFLLRVFLSSPDKSDTADTSEGLDESELESDLSSSKSEPAESSKKSDSSLIALWIKRVRIRWCHLEYQNKQAGIRKFSTGTAHFGLLKWAKTNMSKK